MLSPSSQSSPEGPLVKSCRFLLFFSALYLFDIHFQWRSDEGYIRRAQHGTKKPRSCFQELQNPQNQEVEWLTSDGANLQSITTKCPSLAWKHQIPGASSDCGVRHFDPQVFVSTFRGRTLLFFGDSLSSMSCTNLQDVLRDSGHSVNTTTSGSSYGSSDPFRLRLSFGCQEFHNGILICCGWVAFSNAGMERKIANQDLFSTNKSIGVNVLKPCDLVIWNSGVHHARTFSGTVEDLIPLLNSTFTDWNNMKDNNLPVPSLWWKESYAQHFRSGHWVSRREKVCKDISMIYNENETGIFNSVTEPIALDFNIPIFRVYRASVPLFFAHNTTGDCTHFCKGDRGPMDHDNALLLALLRNAIQGNNIPPLPKERNPENRYDIANRWTMLMEHPTDSLLAKLDVCANPDSSDKHHRWEVDKHGPIPQVLKDCLERSEMIHSS